jgi:ABC-type glycerol-3-phosphate transport system substrate-binding protein
MAGSALLALAGCNLLPSTAPAPPPTATAVPAQPPTAASSPTPPSPTPAPASPTAPQPSATASPTIAPPASPTSGPTPQPSPSAQPSPSPAVQTVLRLATNQAAVEVPWLRKVLDDFTRDNPALRVDPTNVTAGYLEQVAAWGAEGKQPDVLFVHSVHAAAWAYKHWIASIDDLVTRDGQAIDLADLRAPQLQELKLDGKWLLLPYDYTVSVLYSRADANAEVGSQPSDDSTWTDLAAAAKRATKRDVSGVTRWGFSWLPDSSALPGLWLAEAGAFRRDDGHGISISTPDHVRATQFLADLALVDGSAPKPGEAAAGALVAGKLAAEAGTSEAASGYHAAGTKVSATGLPKGPAGRRASYGTGSGWAMAPTTKERDGAWKLLRHLASRDSLEILVALPLRNLPGRVSATAVWQAGLEALGAPEHPEAIVRSASEGFPHQQCVWWLNYQDAVGELMPKVWSGEKKAAEMLPEIERRVNAAAARYSA